MKSIIFTLLLSWLLTVAAFAQSYRSSTPDTTSQERKSLSLTSLLSVQAATEDIQDFALIDDWARIGSDVASLEAAWSRYDSIGHHDPIANMLHTALGNNLNQLKEALAEKDATSATQAASNLSFAISNLIGTQAYVIPSDFLLMEILERQLSVNAAAENFKGADRSFDKLKMLWDRTKGKVQDRRGYELAGKYTASLRAQEIAISVQDGSATSIEAVKGLALLQNLKDLFE